MPIPADEVQQLLDALRMFVEAVSVSDEAGDGEHIAITVYVGQYRGAVALVSKIDELMGEEFDADPR